MLVPSHHGPGHSGELVGKGDGGDLSRPPRQQCRQPGSMLCAMDFSVADHGKCAGGEQAAQIAIEFVLAPARALLRHKPDPSREVPFAISRPMVVIACMIGSSE